MLEMVSFTNMNENSAKNFNRVTVGRIDLYFSYETVVAFQLGGEDIVISENNWGTTTGKHLNWINTDKSIRVSSEEFTKQLNDCMNKIGVND